MPTSPRRGASNDAGDEGRGLATALLALLSEHALQAGIEYFIAEVLAENRTMLALLPGLGSAFIVSGARTVSSVSCAWYDARLAGG